MNRTSTTTSAPDHAATRKRYRREGGRWSRSGCLTCKKRRKRCDEAKPSCHNCTRLGKTCEGYGSMWAEPLDPFAQVFQPEGQKRRKISSSSPCSSDGFSEGSLALSTISPAPVDFDDGLSIDSYSKSEVNDQSEYTIPYASLQPSLYLTHLTPLETHYLQYHIEQGSKLLVNLETTENPLRSLIIPRALSSPLLMKAMCALSAMHFSNRSFDSFGVSIDAQTAATKYYIQTMKGIRMALAEDSGGGVSDEVVLAVGLLCKYEIVRGSVRQWAVHLGALQRLVISRGGYASLDRDTAEFLCGFFTYAHHVAKLTNRRHITGVMPEVDSVRIRKLDIYIGYTEDILKLCARTSDLPSLDPLSLQTEVNDIDTSLQTWSPTTPTNQYIIPQGMTPSVLLRLQMVAECFRDAAYIYLHSILERIPSCQPSLYPISTSKQEALQRCLSRIETFHLDPEYCEYSALTFPLFIAGCECQTIVERDIVMEALGALERNFGIGNVRRAKEILNVLWSENGEGHWLDTLERLKWDVILG
ncbi:Zn(II)2Cys6 transcription factor [Aspergillus chevalieri]|uniref:Zn(2)-C6 fungal-type domain-containing protein n=1 Tax=Aspergillus chevalieri TaxID=182096 RepID=A0A7R7VMX3_ASPCH|nr:uncharacterized protein ACHE_40207S [Aspergillus chevalieri]BCR87643.1 hypothetical protein ACHE_40207S [Aspergillus chevalieri]